MREAMSSIKKKRMEARTYKEEVVSNDIIHDIFLRLPAKTLLRFRSISKYWRNTIDSLPFANMQNTPSQHESPQLLRLPLLSLRQNSIVHSFTYDGRVFNESDEHPIFDYSNVNIKYIVDKIAYGLIFFRLWDKKAGEIFLFNPLRGEVLELPQPSLCQGNNELQLHGIGFDSKTSSYKIVRVYIFIPPRRPKYEIEIYTLGSRSWRVLSPSVCSALKSTFTFSTVSAYGDMHWHNWDIRSNESLIISFDFRNEEFKNTPLPDFGCQLEHFRWFILINLNGFLAAVSFPSDTHIEIWVMKDYEKKEWIREYTISTQVYARDSDNNVVIRPDIYFWEDELHDIDIFVCGRWLFFSYGKPGRVFVLDPETNRLMYQKFPETCEVSKDMSTILSFTGSVLSPKHFGNQIAEVPHKYNFLKTARTVYVSP